MSEYLELPWSVEDTIENLKELKEVLQKRCIIQNLDGRGEKDTEEIAFDFDRAINALEEIQQYREIGTPEECRAAVEKQKEIRNKAIDDFVSEVCKKFTEREQNGVYRLYCCEIKQGIADIAEQLKGGVEE